MTATTLPEELLQRPARRRRRSCAAGTSAPLAPTAHTKDGIELHAGFTRGAWVYERSHRGQLRGYGLVKRESDPAFDGTARW